MSNVYDFRSRKKITTGQNIEANDQTANSEGRYIGNIGTANAKNFRSVVTLWEVAQKEAFEALDRADSLAVTVFTNIETVLMLLKASNQIDHMSEDIQVDEKGNVWIVPAKDKEGFDD